MNENIENVLATLDGFRTNGEMTYSAYSTLHDEISLLDDLLKRQKPRVLTFETIQNDCPDCIYIETASGWIECCIKDEGMSNKFVGYFVCGFGECFIENWNEYWKTWRCWSAWPTDEQRKAVKWGE